MNKPQETGSYADAFGDHLGFSRSWNRFEKIVDSMPFEDELEAEDWKERLKDDKKLRYAMLKDITPKFRRMLAARLRPERNYIIMFCGPMGSGKSILECQICWETKQIAPSSEYKIGMGIDEIRVIFATLPPYGIAVNDEDLFMTGKGSTTATVQAANQFKFARRGERNLMLSAKFYVNVQIANYYLEMFGFNAETGESRFLLRGRTGRWLGVVTLKRTFPDEFYQPFIDAKAAADEQMRKTKGALKAFGDFDLKSAAAAIEQLLREKKFTSTRKTLIKAFIEQQAELDEEQAIPAFHPPEILMNDVIARVQVNLMLNPIQKERKGGSKPQEGESPPLDYKILKEVESPSFLTALVAKMRQKSLEPIKLDVFEMKCAGNGNLDVAQSLGIATGSVFNYHSEILRKYLGYAGEDVFEEDLELAAVEFTHGGSNTPDPDFLIRSPFWLIPEGLTPCVVSFKTYYIFRVHKAVTEIAASEYIYAQEHAQPLLLIAYECRTQLFRVLQIFPGGKNSMKLSTCDSRNGTTVMSTPSRAPPCRPPLRPPQRPGSPPGKGGAQDDSCEPRKIGENRIYTTEEKAAVVEILHDLARQIPNVSAVLDALDATFTEKAEETEPPAKTKRRRRQR